MTRCDRMAKAYAETAVKKPDIALPNTSQDVNYKTNVAACEAAFRAGYAAGRSHVEEPQDQVVS